MIAINEEYIRQNTQTFGNYITKIVIQPNDVNHMLSISGDNVYTSSYNKGYNTAKNIYENQIEELEIEKQQKYNEGYDTGYQNGANTQNTLYNMIIRSLQIHL